MSEEELFQHIGAGIEGGFMTHDDLRESIRSYGDARERAGLERIREALRYEFTDCVSAIGHPHTRGLKRALDLIDALPVPAPDARPAQEDEDANPA